jgi:hypothetical protein
MKPAQRMGVVPEIMYAISSPLDAAERGYAAAAERRARRNEAIYPVLVSE